MGGRYHSIRYYWVAALGRLRTIALKDGGPGVHSDAGLSCLWNLGYFLLYDRIQVLAL